MGCLRRLLNDEPLDSSEISVKTDRRKIDLPTEGLSRPNFFFCDSYFALMWCKSPKTEMCECCNTKCFVIARALAAWEEPTWSSLFCAYGRSAGAGALSSKKSTPKHTSPIPASHLSLV